jgi:hypothetical protein
MKNQNDLIKIKDDVKIIENDIWAILQISYFESDGELYFFSKLKWNFYLFCSIYGLLLLVTIISCHSTALLTSLSKNNSVKIIILSVFNLFTFFKKRFSVTHLHGKFSPKLKFLSNYTV